MKSNGQVRSRRGKEFWSRWPCPECGWVASGPKWQQLKSEHIRRQHPDVAATLGKEERRLVFVPWSPACCWRCPVADCGLGMKDDGTCGQYRHAMRMRHRAECHPDAPRELFFLSTAEDKAVNAAKASIACRNRGAARRIQGLRAAQAAGHDATWVSYPVPPPRGPRKRVWRETLLHRIVCRRCLHITSKASLLADRDCVKGFVSGTLTKMLRRAPGQIGGGRRQCRDPGCHQAHS